MIVPHCKSQLSLYSYFISILCVLLIAGCASNKRVADKKSRKHRSERAYKSKDAYKSKRNMPRAEPNAEPESQLDEVVAIARSYTGVPYRWGGTTRSGMDCSGLLMTSFQAADLNIPRTTTEQVKFGKGITLYDLQPGDLVFFAAAKGNPRKVTHVGMVTEVRDKHDVRFIHASTKLGVVENNIYTDYYRKIFIKARRPF